MKKRQPDRLDIESTKAIEAGMSYGKWKAMQDPVKIIKPDEGMKICAWCGKPFKPKRNNIYCEYFCAYEAKKEREREATGTTTCPGCGKEFKRTKSHYVYCSAECRRITDLRRRKEKREYDET